MEQQYLLFKFHCHTTLKTKVVWYVRASADLAPLEKFSLCNRLICDAQHT